MDMEKVLQAAREAGLLVSTGRAETGPPDDKLEAFYAIAYED